MKDLKTALKDLAKAKGFKTDGLSDKELFQLVTGIQQPSDEMMNGEFASWYVPGGAAVEEPKSESNNETPTPTPDPTPSGGDNEGGNNEGGNNEGGADDPQSEITIDPVKVDSVDDLENIENKEEADIEVSNAEVVNALITNDIFKSIALSDTEVSANDIMLNATDKVSLNEVAIGGEKGTTNGKVNFSAPEAEFTNVSLKDNTTVYNVFEGTQDINKPVSSVVLSNSTFEEPTLTHNVMNVYAPANNANILIKDCTFSLNPEKSNVLRISNITNATNVTVTFENVNWDYSQYNGTDYSYAGLVMYQAYGKDASYRGATSPNADAINTWKFVFNNCKYNGIKVTENGYGTEAQVIYAYDVLTAGKTDATELFTVEFK